MKTIAILGCGNIGRIVAGQAQNVRIVGVFDQDRDRCHAVAALCGATACESFDALMTLDFDLLVEAASVEAVEEYSPRVIEAGRDLVMLSVGALADAGLRGRLENLARVSGARLRIPSGAVIGLDNLKVGRISRLDRLLLKTTKPPAALGVEVDESTCLFRGPATESIKQFPRNINVAVSLSLAADRECEVEIWADPQATGNRHQVIFEGEFGRAEITVDNVPSPDNPRTSYLAALSVLALIDDENHHIRVGT
jgi:aspartate dehydrogenase